MSARRLTGIVVHGYRLSGWRRDKHGAYRMWLGLPEPILAATAALGRRVEAVLPRRKGALCAPQMTTRMVNGATVGMRKKTADAWLTTQIEMTHAARKKA